MKLEGYTPKQILVNLTNLDIDGGIKPESQKQITEAMAYNHVTVQVDTETPFKRIEDAYFYGLVAQVASIRFTSENLGCSFGVLEK